MKLRKELTDALPPEDVRAIMEIIRGLAELTLTAKERFLVVRLEALLLEREHDERKDD